MTFEHARRSLSVRKAAVGLVLVGGATFGVVAATEANSSTSLPQAKQAFVDRVNAFRSKVSPNPVLPDPAASKSIAVAPCTRDVSQLVTGLTASYSGMDFPDWRAYHFNSEWAASDGTQAVQAGNVVESTQGAVTVEQWSPPSNCEPTGSVYLADPGTGSFTITAVAGTTVSLLSSSGTSWSFDLSTHTFAQLGSG